MNQNYERLKNCLDRSNGVKLKELCFLLWSSWSVNPHTDRLMFWSHPPEGLIKKSHFLSGLFQYSLILDPVLQRQNQYWNNASINTSETFFIWYVDSTKWNAYNGEQHKLLQELLGIISIEVSKVGCGQKERCTKWTNTAQHSALSEWILYESYAITGPFLHLELRQKLHSRTAECCNAFLESCSVWWHRLILGEEGPVCYGRELLQCLTTCGPKVLQL